MATNAGTMWNVKSEQQEWNQQMNNGNTRQSESVNRGQCQRINVNRRRNNNNNNTTITTTISVRIYQQISTQQQYNE
jgi:hypothetical protein